MMVMLLGPGLAATSATREVWVLELDGVINPVAAAYIRDNLTKAARADAECLIIQMDTPGGLMSSMRDIIKDILNAPLPVIVFVAPRGAQAASAGVFITIAAHFAAMSPGTNIGAAHPVNLGGGGFGVKPDSSSSEAMMEKVTNDAVAQIRSLAKQRGRNEEWVEQAVRQSVSVTETEAVTQRIVDLIARDLDELIEFLDGKTVQLASGPKVLATHQAKIVRRPLGIHRKILDIISDPTLAYLLLMLGFYGLYLSLIHI